MLHKTGESLDVVVSATPILDHSGRVVAGRSVSTDISRLKHGERELRTALSKLEELINSLRRQPMTDELTGLPNRRNGERQLNTEISRAQRQQCPLSVAFCDVDRFKQVNDTFGHERGDEVLRAVGATFITQLRMEDFVPRWGGEEFLTILAATGRDGTEIVAQRIRLGAAARSVEIAGELTISIGGAVHIPGDAPESLADRADGALYTANRSGRNRVVVAATPSAHLGARGGSHE